MDKRFWSGAVVVLTVVVTGASALPGLLLRPPVEDTPEIVPPFVGKPTGSQLVSQSEPGAAPPVLPVEVKLVAKLQPVAPAPAAQPPEPPQPPPTQAAAPPIPPPAAVAEAPRPASAFPPVQLLDAPVQAVAPTQTRAASATRPPVAPRGERAARHTDRQDDAKRRRHVRPATYPIREFLAWRR